MYVLNELEEPEASEIRKHLAERCTRCRGEVRTSLELWYLTALTQVSDMRAEPSAGLRRRVLQAAQGVTDNRRGEFFRKWIWIPAFAATALILVAIWSVNRSGAPGGPALELERQRGLLELAQRSAQQWQDRAEEAERRLEARGSAPAPLPFPAAPPQSRPVNPEISGELARARSEVQTLTDSLARESARAAVLAAELSSQRSLLASVQQQKDDAEKQAQGAAEERSQRVELEARLAGVTARVQQLTRENASYRETVDSLTRQVDRGTRLVAFLGSESLKMVKLQSTEAGGKASGQAFIVDGQKVVFYASGLPNLAPGRSYQLWLLRGKNPAIVSGGVFRPNGAERLSLEFADPAVVGDIRGLAVTEEPEGGSRGPTGHKLLVGTSRS